MPFSVRSVQDSIRNAMPNRTQVIKFFNEVYFNISEEEMRFYRQSKEKIGDTSRQFSGQK